MSSHSPTILAVEIDSAWAVVLGVSCITLIAALILRRIIKRPGGYASGLLLLLPLLLPLVAAFVYQHALLPEVAVLRPAGEALLDEPGKLMHFLFLSDGRLWIPYAFSGEAGRWIFFVGAAFSSFMLMRRFVGWVVLQRVIAAARRVGPDEPLGAMVQRLAKEAGLKRSPQVLLLSDRLSGAFAVGARPGKVLVSPDVVEALEPEELEAVLAHEVAHIEARDVPVVFAAGFLRDLVAWNPFAHLAYRRLLTDREFEADRRAAMLTGPLALASGLLKVFEMVRRRRSYGQKFALALLRPRTRVTRRISHLLALADGRGVESPVGRSVYLMAACLVVVVGWQAGAKMAAEDTAFAFVLGSTNSGTKVVYNPAKEPRAAKGARNRAEASARGGQAQKGAAPAQAKLQGGQLERLLRAPELATSLALRARDLSTYAKKVASLSERLGIPVAILQWEGRQVLGPSTFGVYRIDLQTLDSETPR